MKHNLILPVVAGLQAVFIAVAVHHILFVHEERDWLREEHLKQAGVLVTAVEQVSAIAKQYEAEIQYLKREQLKSRIANYVRSVYKDAPAEVIADTVLEASDETGIDHTWLLAKLKQESYFNPRAVSRTGCRGLAQMCMEASAEMGIAWDDNFNPRLNILAGARYLKKQINAYNGNIRQALIRYNGNDDPKFVEKIEQHRNRILVAL